MVIKPWSGPYTGEVFAVNIVPSGSISPAVIMFPLNGVSSFVIKFSFVIVGGSFTAVTVINKVSFTQEAGNGLPASHIWITTVSKPL